MGGTTGNITGNTMENTEMSKLNKMHLMSLTGMDVL